MNCICKLALLPILLGILFIPSHAIDYMNRQMLNFVELVEKIYYLRNAQIQLLPET